jgi:hypothetical protein
MAAGLPLLVGSTGLLAQGGNALHDHQAPVTPGDPVLDQILRQMAAIHNRIQAGPRGEHARALAMQLRMLAVYQRQLGVDDHLRTAMREIVDREGRNAILFPEPDTEMRDNALRRYGFRPDARGRDVAPPATYQRREAALDRLLREGVTPTFDALAATAARLSQELDRRPTGLINIAVQDDPDYIRGYCESLWDSYVDAQAMALPVCVAAKYFEWVTPSCLALEGGAMSLMLVWVFRCRGIGN